MYSRSQHFTCLSSPAENRYGWRGLTTRPRTVLTWPVNDSFRVPVAKSQIYAAKTLTSCHQVFNTISQCKNVVSENKTNWENRLLMLQLQPFFTKRIETFPLTTILFYNSFRVVSRHFIIQQKTTYRKEEICVLHLTCQRLPGNTYNLFPTSPMQLQPFFSKWIETFPLRGRSQLSTFMKAYTAYAFWWPPPPSPKAYSKMLIFFKVIKIFINSNMHPLHHALIVSHLCEHNHEQNYWY